MLAFGESQASVSNVRQAGSNRVGPLNLGMVTAIDGRWMTTSCLAAGLLLPAINKPTADPMKPDPARSAFFHEEFGLLNRSCSELLEDPRSNSKSKKVGLVWMMNSDRIDRLFPASYSKVQFRIGLLDAS